MVKPKAKVKIKLIPVSCNVTNRPCSKSPAHHSPSSKINTYSGTRCHCHV
ncbi:Uncharacterised protein [Vibrio cholerae]|nr:Uncharacterised protein [Vibrio cholerae]CSI71637.1 Uncharacterised protein [Vibrio cholerae]